MRQRGFGIPISLILYGVAAAALVGGAWWVVTEWNEGRAAQQQVSAALKECPAGSVGIVECVRAEQAEQRRIQAAYDAFALDTKKIGLAAQEKADREKLRQDQVNKERTVGYEKRLAAINDAYRRLRDGRSGASAGSGAVSAIPDASIRAADPASDNRLLEALRAADEQTARLIELQRWVSEQGKVSQ
jgi:hypothetical protein